MSITFTDIEDFRDNEVKGVTMKVCWTLYMLCKVKCELVKEILWRWYYLG